MLPCSSRLVISLLSPPTSFLLLPYSLSPYFSGKSESENFHKVTQIHPPTYNITALLPIQVTIQAPPPNSSSALDPIPFGTRVHHEITSFLSFFPLFSNITIPNSSHNAINSSHLHARAHTHP